MTIYVCVVFSFFPLESNQWSIFIFRGSDMSWVDRCNIQQSRHHCSASPAAFGMVNLGAMDNRHLPLMLTIILKCWEFSDLKLILKLWRKSIHPMMYISCPFASVAKAYPFVLKTQTSLFLQWSFRAFHGFLILLFALAFTEKYSQNCCATMLFLSIELWTLTASIRHIFLGKINWFVFQHCVFGGQMTFEMREFHGFIARTSPHVTTYHLCSVHCHQNILRLCTLKQK